MKKTQSLFFIIALMMALMLFGAGNGYALHTWTGAGSDWADAANWDQGTVPMSGDDVALVGGTVAQPIVPVVGGAACRNISISTAAGAVTLQLNGNLTLDAASDITVTAGALKNSVFATM